MQYYQLLIGGCPLAVPTIVDYMVSEQIRNLEILRELPLCDNRIHSALTTNENICTA